MTGREPVTVYVPAYNVAEFLPACLAAIQAQTHPIQRIVVVDDGSSDGSAGIAEQMGARVIPHPRNLGLAQARRTAFQEIDCPLIASLDADCEPEPTWLATLMREMENPAVAGACGVLLERNRSRMADLWRATHMKQSRGRQRVNGPDLVFGNNNVFRRQAILEAGSYPTDPIYRTNNEDYYMSRRLRERGWRLVYIPTARVVHNRTDSIGSINRTYWRWYFLDRIPPTTAVGLLAKAKDNLLRGIQFGLRDLARRRWRLLPFDLLLFPTWQGYLDRIYYRENRGQTIQDNRSG